MTQIELRDPKKRIDDEEGRAREGWRSHALTDMDRIWYAPEFRRLEGVTQVVPPQEEYVYHDRLTHSMKVAQVGATLARMLAFRAKDDEILAQELEAAGLKIEEWIDPDHCYAAGLAHDIGHPPFGHAGEQALQQMHEEGFLEPLKERSFEGNAQSMRIVATLSFRKTDQDGLNLTLRTLAAIAKYPWLRLQHPASIEKLGRKWSFYPDDADILTKLEDHGFIVTIKSEADRMPRGARRPQPVDEVERVIRWPEAEIMDWADDISYAVHDVEDFFRAGRIPLHRIAAALKTAPVGWFEGDEKARANWRTTDFGFAEDDEEIQLALQFARAKMAKQLDQDGKSLVSSVPDAFSALKEHLLYWMPTNRFDGSRASATTLQGFGSKAIVYLSVSTQVVVIEAKGERRIAVRVDPAAQLVAEFFKSLCQYFVINTSALATMQRGQMLGMKRLVEGLKEIAVMALKEEAKLKKTNELHSRVGMNSLPSRLAEYLYIRTDEANGGLLTDAEVGVAVIDYVCGLRDIQATILEARLFGDLTSLSFSSNWLDS